MSFSSFSSQYLENYCPDSFDYPSSAYLERRLNTTQILTASTKLAAIKITPIHFFDRPINSYHICCANISSILAVSYTERQ